MKAERCKTSVARYQLHSLLQLQPASISHIRLQRLVVRPPVWSYCRFPRLDAMAKTTTGDLEARTYWCVGEFAKQSLLGGAVGLLISVIAFKQHAALGIYGAGLGGGYAAFSCSSTFAELNPVKLPAPVPAPTHPSEQEPMTIAMTDEQQNLLDSLHMMSVIKEKSN